MRSSLWLLAGILAACRFGFDKRPPDGDSGSADVLLDDGGTPIPPFQPFWASGTRLRARLLVPVDGGDPFFVGWHDTQLDMNCINGLAGDGVERCVSTETRGNIFYADAACTVPLAWVRPRTCGGIKYAYDADTNGRYHTYVVGAAYTGTVYERAGTCVPSTPPSTGTLHATTGEVAATMLAATSYANVQVGDFRRPRETHSDGSYVELGSLVAAGGTCYPRARELGASPCVGTTFRGKAVFRDSACTQRAYLWERAVFDPPSTPSLAIFDPTDPCEHSVELIDTIADVTGANHYVQGPSGCTMALTAAGDRLYTGEPAAATYPSGTITVGPRRGRLGYLYWTGSDGIPLATRYWDHDLRMPCLPINATDGKLRCLPTQLPAIPAHTDADCASAQLMQTPACFPGMPVDGPDYHSCTDTWIVSSLASFGATAWTYDDATCTPLDAVGDFYNAAVTTDVLPPSMFAEMSEIIE